RGTSSPDDDLHGRRSARLNSGCFLTPSEALEIPKTAVAYEREDGSLWVRALDDPVALQYFNRVSEDLSATSLHALYARCGRVGRKSSGGCGGIALRNRETCLSEHTGVVAANRFRTRRHL